MPGSYVLLSRKSSVGDSGHDGGMNVNEMYSTTHKKKKGETPVASRERTP